MITKEVWEDIYGNICSEPVDYMIGVMKSLLTVPLDILLSPFEIIAFIIYKLSKKN